MTKYGLDIILASAIATVLISTVSIAFLQNQVVKVAAVGLFSAAFLFTLYFFRDPERTPPRVQNLVVSPADGKVVRIQEIFEPEFLNADGVQVSIFLSPFDVHVNRVPVSGRVAYYRYIKGDYLVAFDDKASARNERTHIGIENGAVRILFRQIAGFIARRIVCTLREGDSVTCGDRFGMIKFGSRVDVVVPREAELKVSLQDSVVGGETVLAVLPMIASEGV